MPAPANDLIANAQLISGASGSVGPVTIDDATETNTEDTSPRFMWQTIWYKWVAPSSGRFTLSTLGSLAGDASSGDANPDVGAFGSLDTKLQLWHGTTPGSLTSVAFNDDTDGDPSGYGGYWSQIQFGVTSGETYYIQIGVFAAAAYTGTAQLSWTLTSTTASNDNIANAVVIANDPTIRSGSSGPLPIDAATLETGETTNGEFGANQMHQTLWWKWTVDTYLAPSFSATSSDVTPRLLVYWSPDGSTNFAQFESVWYASSGTTPPLANVEPGWVLYISVGTFANGQAGDIDLSWDLGFPFEDVIADCPVEVVAGRAGSPPQRTNPNSSSFGSFSDGYLDWYEPGHVTGELLLWIGIGDYLGQSAPPGYTEVYNGEWDNAPQGNPSPRGDHGTEWVVNSAHVQLIIAYRIAAETVSFAVANATIAGTITGLSYSDHSYTIWEAATGGDGNTGFGVRVYSFSLETMFQDFDQSFDWPANPVKVGTLVNTDYQRDLSRNQTSPSDGYNPHPIDLAVPDTTADHIGNHIYMTLVMNHGNVQGSSWRTFDPDRRRTSFDLLDQFFMRSSSFDSGSIYGGSAPDGTLFTGDHRYNNILCQPYISNRDYFQPFRPESWIPLENDITWSAENGFSDTTPAPGHSIQAGAASDGTELWWDGGIGVSGTDFFYWTLTGAVGLVQLVIQGPEVQRPPNDLRENAYEISSCPITVVECVYGQTDDGDEPIPGGTDDGEDAAVWFKFTPTVSQDDLIMKTFTAGFRSTTYDTILSVFDSGMNLIVTNDNFSAPGSFSLSQVTLDVVAGQTYYIQVAGYGGDEGDLYLSIDCTGELLPYWGILNAAM